MMLYLVLPLLIIFLILSAFVFFAFTNTTKEISINNKYIEKDGKCFIIDDLGIKYLISTKYIELFRDKSELSTYQITHRLKVGKKIVVKYYNLNIPFLGYHYIIYGIE